MQDSEFDYWDIPEVSDFSGFHHVQPRSLLVRIDGDILDWAQTLGYDHQALVNDILRRQMLVATVNNA